MRRRAPRKRALPRGRMLAPALAAMLAAFLWLPSAPGIAPKETRIWNGYMTLAVRADVVRARGAAALATRLGPGVVCDITALADFWDFTGLARVPYAVLDARLDPLDPRRDRFIDGAAAYFRATGSGTQWWLAYLPADTTSFRLFLRAVGLLGFPFHDEWRLAEFDLVEKALALLAVFGLAMLLALSLEEARQSGAAVAACAALLWAPFLLSGGLAQLAICLVLLLAWFPLLRTSLRLRDWGDHVPRALKNPLLSFAFIAASGLLVSIVAGGFTFPRLVSFVSPVVTTLLLLPVLTPFSLAAAGWRRRRRVFTPVPIVRPSADPRRGRTVSLFFASFALVIAAILPLARGLPLPAPRNVIGAYDFSWQSLGRLSAMNRAQRMPDFSDLVSHAAFQETMAFGRPWRTPVRDERVAVREFLANPETGAIVARERTVKVFDSTWLSSVRRRAVPGSLEAMLFAQGRPVMVAIRGVGYVLVRELPIAFLVLCGLLALLWRDLGLGPLIRGNLPRLNSAARRDQVP